MTNDLVEEGEVVSFTIDGWHETSTVMATITDAPRRRSPYSNMVERMYQPTRARFIWNRGIDNPTWHLRRIEIEGPIVLKDGTLSKGVKADESFDRASGSWRDNWSWDLVPEWLKPIAEAGQPAS